MKNFYLIRHGETEWNLVRKLQGQIDSPLTPNGIRQANSLGAKLQSLNIEKLFSSPVGRASKTAEILLNYLSLTIVEYSDALVERDFGDWQGRYFESLRGEAFFNEIFEELSYHKPPNGESAKDCVKRVKKFLSDVAVKYSETDIAVVTHGDVIRTLLLDLGLSDQVDAYSRVGNGSVFCLSYTLAGDFKVLPTR